MLIVKQRPCSTNPQSTHASHSVPSANGSWVQPKGIPPRREADLCKGHCVNRHTLSLAAAVTNCLWRSLNEILVNPPPNTTKIQHHHHAHKWPWDTSQLVDELRPSRDKMRQWQVEKAVPFCKLKDNLLISSNKGQDIVFLHHLVWSTIALIIPLKLPPDSEQPKSWNRGNLFNQ